MGNPTPSQRINELHIECKVGWPAPDGAIPVVLETQGPLVHPVHFVLLFLSLPHFKYFCKKDFIFNYVSACAFVWVCVRKCKCPWKPEEVTQFPEAGTIGGCKPPCMGAEKRTEVLWNTAHTLNYLAVSPTPEHFFTLTAAEHSFQPVQFKWLLQSKC